jgi:hypothetical protein
VRLALNRTLYRITDGYCSGCDKNHTRDGYRSLSRAQLAVLRKSRNHFQRNVGPRELDSFRISLSDATSVTRLHLHELFGAGKRRTKHWQVFLRKIN